jgi:site-specific DNA-methyltransferase (adenine-specific)
VTCAIEDAGFEIRDMISWLYFSGFPKNHAIGKAIDREAGAQREIIGKHANPASEIFSGGSLKKDVPITKPKTEDAQRFEGFGTALKPAQEPAVLARKPIESGLTIAQNVLKHGVGAINIDDCRFGYGDPCWVGPQDESGLKPYTRQVPQRESQAANHQNVTYRDHHLGRWPANIYQCPKPSRAEREAGLSHLKKRISRSSMNTYNGQGERFDGAPSPEVLNIHPTVKPIKLFRWLSRLIGMEKGNTILDPFCGSGTTGCAALLESYNFIGIEREKEYIPIIEGRCEWAKNQYKRENAQLSLFDDLT